MLTSENEIELENKIKKYLYENNCNNVEVNISCCNINVSMEIYFNDKYLYLRMFVDNFESEEHFYTYVVMVINEYLK